MDKFLKTTSLSEIFKVFLAIFFIVVIFSIGGAPFVGLLLAIIGLTIWFVKKIGGGENGGLLKDLKKIWNEPLKKEEHHD